MACHIASGRTGSNSRAVPPSRRTFADVLLIGATIARPAAITRRSSMAGVPHHAWLQGDVEARESAGILLTLCRPVSVPIDQPQRRGLAFDDHVAGRTVSNTIKSIGTLSPAADMAAMTLSRPCQSPTMPTKPRTIRSPRASRRGRRRNSAGDDVRDHLDAIHRNSGVLRRWRFRAPVTARALSAECQTYASSRVASPRRPRPPNRERSAASGALISSSGGTPTVERPRFRRNGTGCNARRSFQCS